ncbi:MAG: ABC transporter permease, partial [Sphingopyxis sp.]
YSVDRLAPWFQTIAHANPVYYAIMGFRYGFIGTVDSTIANPVATAALFLIVVNAALGLITYRLLVTGWKLKA